MISALKQLVAPTSEPLHLYWGFRDSARKHPAAMMHFDTPLPTFPELGIHATYAEVLEAIECRGAWLISHGMMPGKHTAVFKSASLDSYMWAVAIGYASGVPVMISPHLPAETLDALLHRLDDPWVLYDAETAEKVSAVDGATPQHKINLADYEPVDEPAAPAPRGRVDAVAYMTHTSGTTGVPKLIVHSQTSMGWRVLWQQRVLSAVDKDSLVAFHISPVHSRFNIGIASLMSYGFSLLNISDPSLPNVEATLRRYRPKVLETHPNHFVRWLTLVESDPSVFSSIKYLHSTFDAINKETMAKYLRASQYKVPVFLQVYGQSECGPMIMRAHTPQTLRLTNARWVGVGMPRMTKARIVDQHGRVQRRRKSGAIQMYSRGRALTYWREEDRFNQNLYGQWWDSGDVGIKGYLGQIALLDRQVDLIANVESTLALEDRLLDQHSFLSEIVFVRGQAGEPQPVVAIADGHEMDWEAWWKSVADLPHMAAPLVLPYEDLPRTATMKVQRNQLEAALPRLQASAA